MVHGTILLLYDDSAAAAALLTMACRIAGQTGRIVLLYVLRVPSTLPLAPLPHWFDRDANTALDHAEVVARQQGVQVDTLLVHSHEPAETIVQAARDCEAEAIFLPLCGWQHPVRRMRMVLMAHLIARGGSWPVLLGSWMVPSVLSSEHAPPCDLAQDVADLKGGGFAWRQEQPNLRYRLARTQLVKRRRAMPRDES
jgi:hypothetical protein